MDIKYLPDPLKQFLSPYCNLDDIRVAAASDMTGDNRYGEEWLVATSRELLVVSRANGSAQLLSSHKMADINNIGVVNLVGSSVIEIETQDASRRLITYSNARNLDFAWALEDIKDLLAGKKPQAERKDRVKKTCPSCHLPIPEDLNKCPRCTEKSKTFKRIMAFTRPYLKYLGLIFLTMTAGTCFGLISPYMSKLFVDYILQADPATGIFTYARWLPLATLALLLAHVGQLFFSSLQERLSGLVGNRTVYDVRAAIYEKLQELSLAYFDKHQTGAIMARVNQDTRELQRFLVDFIPITLESGFTLVGVGVFLFILSWQLTLLVLIPILCTVLFLKKIFPRVRPYFRRYFHRRSRLSAQVNDSISGMRVIKAFGQEGEENAKFDAKSGAFRDAGIDLAIKWSIYHPILHLFIMLGAILVWSVGGQLVVLGHMTVGSVVAYSGYLMMFFRPIMVMTRMVEWFTNSLIAAERVFDVIDTEPDIQDAPDAVGMAEIKGEIEFKQVVFGYNRFTPVIKNMSFDIKANEVVGLVGKSGAGKSTIINLFCRLYDVNQGAILIDNVDVRKIRYGDLRHQIGVVLQETFLFNGTIFENIAYARPHATREEVIEAAMTANAHEFIIEKQDGYDTEVGERGNRLSGGEKQRIAIARAILRDPRILVLDEATSSVDTETESKIQDALARLIQGRTTITIAHRLSTLRNCHRLFVIDEGELVEVGTHEELLAKQGIFYNLVSMQRRLSEIIAVEG